MLTDIEIPIVIVGFGNADDVVRCLSALGKQRGCPKFGVFLCENAGRDAFNVLAGALSQAGGPCSGAFEQAVVTSPDFLRVIETSLAGRAVPVFVAEAKENFGFAGGVNTWIRLFLREQGWTGVWILNPDTWPEPDALAELVASAEGRHKGMVTSRIMIPGRDDVNSSRGLKWDKLRAKTIGVDIFAPVDPAPDPDDVERRMDAPTGVSLYVSKECIDKIGLMDESYFLYFEEFDWGLLAKVQCGIGYAHNSIVPHVSGSSTGAVRDRRKRSQLAVYLRARNTIHFVRRHYPKWLLWTVLVSFLRTGQYPLYGSMANFVAAVNGIVAGLRGETGRPKLGVSRVDQGP